MHMQYMKGLNASYTVTIPLYYAAAMAGYLTFGKAVNGDILLSISQNTTSTAIMAIISVTQILVVIHVLVAFQVCRSHDMHIRSVCFLPPSAAAWSKKRMLAFCCQNNS
jgi:hypothetical protein